MRRAAWLAYLPALLLLAAYLQPVGGSWRERVVGPFLGIDAILQTGILEWTGRHWWQPAVWSGLPIFHPAGGATAFMDGLVGQALLVWPLRLVPGVNPVLLYNAAWLGAMLVGAAALLWLWSASGPGRDRQAMSETVAAQSAPAVPGKPLDGTAGHLARGALLLVLLGSPYTLSQLGHLNQLPPPGPPLALAGLLLALRRRRPAREVRATRTTASPMQERRPVPAAGTAESSVTPAAPGAGPGRTGLWIWAAAVTLQAAWGWYGLAATLVVSALVLLPVLAHAWHRQTVLAWLRALAGPVAAAAAGVLLLAWPYLAAAGRQPEYRRTAAEVRVFAADLPDLVNTGAYRWGWSDVTGRRLTAGERAVHRRRQVLHPGWLALGVAAYGVARRRRIGSHTRQAGDFLLAAGLAGMVLAFGESAVVPGTATRVPLPLGVLQEALPPLQSLRAVTRFSYLMVLAVAWWAAVGLGLLAAADRRPRGTALAAGLLGLILLESWPVGLTAVEPYRPTSLAHWPRAADPVASLPSGAVLTLPAPATEQQEDRTEARWLLRALSHGHPVTGGVSGWVPPEARELRIRLNQVLRGEADLDTLMEDMRDAGVLYVEVAADPESPDAAAASRRWQDLLAVRGGPWLPSVPGYRYLVIARDAAAEAARTRGAATLRRRASLPSSMEIADTGPTG
ncbi:MAG: hypothetical protein R6X25_02230 [Candidatus Krumholzibacteriia bacterium]